MTDTPVDFEAALLYCREQAAHIDVPSYYSSPTWHNLCQAFCHEIYGLHTGGNASAWIQWNATSPAHRHTTLNLDSAPVGSLLCTKGSSPFGHIFPAAHPFKDGTPGAWSTDLPVDNGHIGKVHRNAPILAWGHRPLGYITEINGFALDLTHTKNPPKPIQNKRYQRIEHAIQNLQHAVDQAKADKDHGDVVVLRNEIHRLKDLYSKIKHS